MAFSAVATGACAGRATRRTGWVAVRWIARSSSLAPGPTCPAATTAPPDRATHPCIRIALNAEKIANEAPPFR
jgi:hypothetical protein